jgi:hypothetical protein
MSETPNMKQKSSKTSNQQHSITKSKTDSKAEIVDPIDFSFRDLMHFEG